MKKTIRLTEADLTRIVKRIINEDLALLGDDNDYPKKKSIGNIIGRKIETSEDARYYTRGTKISVDNLMRLLDMDHNIYVYINGDKRVFLDYTTGNAYSEKDILILNVKKGGSFGSQFNKLEDYLENDDDLSDDEFMGKYKDKDLGWDAPTNKKLERMRSIRNKKRGGMNEDLMGLLDGDNDYPKKKSIGNIIGRKIETSEDARKYTRGTKISVDNLMTYLDKGHDVYVYINGDKRVFLDYTTGNAYSEKDILILNVKKGGSFGSQFNRLEDYLES